MRIQRLHVENFGKLNDFDLELKDGLHVICAENGWGKSTLAAFIKAMFYGLDYTTKRSLKENERKKYFPWQGGSYGGSLEFTAAGKPYRVERSFGVKDREDTFALYDLDTGLESRDYSEQLGEELFHLNRAAFERSSFFSQKDLNISVNDSLSAGLTHVDEDAGDMKNYEKAVSSLESRMKYYQKTGGRGQIDRLKGERRKVRELLEDLKKKEETAAGWRAEASEKEKQEQEFLVQIRGLEKQLEIVRAYGEQEAKKAQHELLKKQAYGREAELQKTAAALAGFVRAPLKEEELDRCRQMIYRIDTLRQQVEDAQKQVRQKKDTLEQLECSADSVPKQEILFRVLMGFLLVAGAAAVICGRLLPGIFLIAAGLLIAFGKIKKARTLREKITSAGQALAEAEKTCRVLTEKKEKQERQVCRLLHLPEGAGLPELKMQWKQERQHGQEYKILKNTYESQRKEAMRSREEWLQFRGGFSEEELSKIMDLQKPKMEAGELRRERDALLSRRENLMKERSDMENRIRVLEEQAERIPELQEEDERLAQELDKAVREHGLLETTLKYLRTAREQFSTRYLKELQEGLFHYLALMEPEQKTGMMLDVKLNLKIQEAGAFRDPEYFSEGWQDLFRIAERFSIIDALYKEEQPVLILDDPFVNLDEGKQKRAMEVLEKMAEKRQVIYFTAVLLTT